MKRIIALLLILAFAVTLIGCGGKGDGGTSSNPSSTAQSTGSEGNSDTSSQSESGLSENPSSEQVSVEPQTDFKISAADLDKYKIVLPKYNTSYFVVRKAEDLRDAIKAKTGKTIEIVRDSEKATAYEIIIGDCNRAGVKSVSDYETYTISNNGKSIFINGGRNYSIAYALQILVDDVNSHKAITYTLMEDKFVNELDFRLVWQDEFEGDEYNGKIWLAQDRVEPWMGSWHGRQVYRSNTRAIEVKDGKLYQIASYDDDYFYGVYMTTSRSLNFTYGYTEISSKLADGEGLWHCFWVWNDFNTNDDILEFDIMECWSGSQYYVNAIHESIDDKEVQSMFSRDSLHSYVTIDGVYKNDDSNFWLVEKQKRTSDRLMSEQFHNFGFYWDEQKVEFYRDGELTLRNEYVGTPGESLYRLPHYMILSFSVGSNSGNLPQDTPDDDKRLAGVKKPILNADYWKNGKNIWAIEYIQLFQKDGWYLKLN